MQVIYGHCQSTCIFKMWNLLSPFILSVVLLYRTVTRFEFMSDVSVFISMYSVDTSQLCEYGMLLKRLRWQSFMVTSLVSTVWWVHCYPLKLESKNKIWGMIEKKTVVKLLIHSITSVDTGCCNGLTYYRRFMFCTQWSQ